MNFNVNSTDFYLPPKHKNVKADVILHALF